MRKVCCLACIVFILMSGCSLYKVSNRELAVSSPANSDVTEPNEPVDVPAPVMLSLVSVRPGSRYPEPFGRLSPSGVTLTVLDARKWPIVSIDQPQGGAVMPVDREGGYEVEILLDNHYTVEGLPSVESQAWTVSNNSGIRWTTVEGATAIRFRIVVNDRLIATNPEDDPLDMPITIMLLGVMDRAANKVPVEFTLRPEYVFATISGSQYNLMGYNVPDEVTELALTDAYEIDILFHPSIDIKDASVQVDPDAWLIRGNFPISRVTSDGSGAILLHIDAAKGRDDTARPINVVVSGVKDVNGLPYPVNLTIWPREHIPAPTRPRITHSRYNIVHEGKRITDDRLLLIRQEYANGSLLLIPFSTDNELAADFRVALYDTQQDKALFVADLKTFSGLHFWTGWLNEEEFYIGNNYNLVVYNINGKARDVLRLDRTKGSFRNAIHGLGWSTATQTMAVLYCDGKTDTIDLLLLTDDLNKTTKVASVDKQDPYLLGGERFPMQVGPMIWDDKGEQLAFTKTKNHSLAIYNRSTGVIEDVVGTTKVSMIEYNPETKQFTTSQTRW